jgi:LuxR family maltose regulon positive regulatory protein
MGISVNTVRSHVQAVLRKLGAERRLEAVHRAGAAGLLESLSA